MSTASAPFDNLTADLVVRTSDHTQFHVVKAILSVASPVFADMFRVAANLPPETVSPCDYIDGVPVVEVTEDRKTIDTILRLCYPVNNPILSDTDIDTIVRVYDAGKKYEIEVTQNWSTSSLKDRAREDVSSFTIFLIAYQLGLEDLAKFAARQLLSVSMPDILSVRALSQLSQVHATVFPSLWAYRTSCQQAMVEVAVPYYWLDRYRTSRAPLWTAGRDWCCCMQTMSTIYISRKKGNIDVG